jgi:amino acid adenylation domain-containing protein
MKLENVHEVFSRVAAEHGERVAVRRGDERMTYRELDERSNRLANHLVANGARKDSLVAILTSDRIDVIAAIIGVLKAGCVFIPLDPEMPSNRLTAMIEQVSPDFFLNHIEGLNSENPCLDVDPTELRYIYFTSGSTGKPKAIAGALKGVNHFIDWEIRTFGIESGTRVSQFTTPSFDASLRDFFVPLCSGGTICIPATVETVLDPGKLVKWIDDEQINLIHCVPSLFRAIVNEELHPKQFAALRCVLMAGEPLLPSDVRRWMDVFGERIQLVNLYGPTETTMVKFFYFVTAADKDLQSIPIGQPMSGAKALLVDAHGKACRPGKVGEIHIRTPYRTLGYYKAPELTSEVFIRNPFSDDPEDVIYKTGDLGRLLADGNFEFLGRRDQQIKIRGVRVELKEIENVLRAHEAVNDVAVTEYQQGNGDSALCAYVVLNRETPAEDLREFMRRDLPELMVPAAFVVMSALPRTFNGKIDRRALPQPDPERNLRKGPFVAPRTSTEEIVAGVWSQVLGLKQISVHDNFLNLGGHSLRMTQVTSRLSKTFGVELPLRALFESPTVADLATRIETIVRSNNGVKRAPLTRVSRDRKLPLSFSQQRLWFLHQLDPASTVYNLPMAARLKGELNLAALQRSLNELARRHEVIRTTFVAVDGKPVQIIAPQAAIPLNVVDLSEMPDDDLAARQIVNEDGGHPFNLAEGPLIRVRLLLLGPGEYVLLVNQHHIISDAWSTAVMIHELASLYESFSRGETPALPELPLQYADYAHWQQDLLHGEVLASELSYWEGQLTPAPPALQLPVDRPRPATPIFRGARRHFSFTPQLSESLINLSRQEGASLFMTFLAAFQTLLGRYTRQSDICVGSPIAGRNQIELEEVIGFFVNTLVLRTDLSGNPTFQELLKRVRATCLGAYANQDVPFERLIQHLQPERSLNRTPLFQVMMTLQNTPAAVSNFGGLDWAPLEVDERWVDMDLVLSLMDTPQGVIGLIDYSADLFDDATIDRMLDHFRVLLESIVAEPQQRIEQLQLMDAIERQQILVEWNATKTDWEALSLPEMFEAQVEKTPDALALRFCNQELSYRELNARANQRADYLRARGVGPEVCVGVSVERSIEMVVWLLGILKAGGAYVPFEPGHPAERNRFTMEEAQVKVVVTGDYLHVLSKQPTLNPQSSPAPDNLAYVIFTSGSTGRPKGVAVPHRAVANTLQWRKDTFALSASDRIFQNIPFTFDPSLWQIFGALISGATLVIAEPDQHQDARYVVRSLAREEITITDFPPSMLQRVVDEEGFADCDRLRIVFSGGEALSLELQNRFLNRSRSELFNQYGPSEAAIDAAFWKCSSEAGYDVVPIGLPIANKQIYILDKHLQPTPIGVPGELHIGGIGLARGYVNQPELTAEKFVPNPFSDIGGERLYRTGDLARYRPGGVIEFMGRIDHQVKIRGNRVELGEVESVLIQDPAVRECVVVTQDGTGDLDLVAFIVVNEGYAPAANEIRGTLREKLPEYMVPAAVVLLDRLPRTASGKIDRALLPVVARGRREQTADVQQPRTPIEEVMSGIWADVLGLETVGANEDFFDLGGHSLLATQVISRVRKAFPIEIPLRMMFESSTVAGLSKNIEHLLKTSQDAPVSPVLVPLPRNGPLPLSFAQQRLWFLEQLYPNTPTYNMPLAVRLTGKLDTVALERALNEIVRRHEVLRTTFSNSDGNPIQIVSEAHVLLRIRDEQEIHVRHAVKEESQTPFDLSEGPLLRATLLRLGDEEHVLLLTTHHIVSDGWSMGVLIKETAALYEAFSKEQLSPLPELRIQYVDFAAWQRQRLDGEALAAEIAYWRDHLGGSLPVLDLPTDRPRPRLQSFPGAFETLVIDKELTDATKTLSRREGATLFMTLLATFTVLLSRHTSQNDILIGTPVANRNEIELEAIIGFFVNTLVLRTDLSGNPTFRELLARIRELSLGAYMHQELPFEELVKELQPQRDLSRAPIFQVMFSLQTATGQTPELPGLKMSPIVPDSMMAQFDLTLSVVETERSLTCSFAYNTDLFYSSTIARMADHYKLLLDGFIGDPERRLNEVSLTTDAERLLLNEWNNTNATYPHGSTLVQLLEAQAERTPNSIAVTFEDQTISYAELHRRANQLGRYLRKRGVHSEVKVGICVERSIDMVVGLLGILKAGAAYVPMDPTYPRERLNFMLEDSQVALVLTNKQLLESTTESDEPITDYTHPDNLVYVIYTSGSTGVPKGVQIANRSVVSFLNCMARTLGLSARDRLLSVTTLSFDIAALEIFLPLIAGARLIITRRDAVADKLPNSDATVMQATPATWRFLLESGWQGDPNLKMLCGGEALSPELAGELVKKGATLWNLYGPTETTIWSAAGEIHSPNSPVYLGRPIDNTQIYILDAQLHPAPLGVAGELCIGGVGVARGYLNQPALTAEKFIPDPFSAEPGVRLYRTGDRARFRATGELEFLGRRDFQVKLRGHRIELGEIESALRSHSDVKEAVVALKDAATEAEKRLVAYVVPNEQLSVKELRDHVRATLPDYMVPSVFVELQKLPLTPNGKLDRAALPKPSALRSESTGVYVAPQNDVELQLAQIWEEVLSVHPIGIHDNFFELGGHSFLALRLMGQIQKRFGRQLPLVSLFEGATIHQLAQVLQKQTTHQAKSPLVAIQPAGSKPPFFCVHEITGSVLGYVNLARHLGLDQPFYGLQTPDFGDNRRPYETLQEMAADYIKELRQLQPEGPYHLGGWSSGGLVAFEMAQQLARDSQEVALLALIDTAVPSHNGNEEYDDASLLAGLAHVHNLSITVEELRSVPADEQFRYALEKANLGDAVQVEQLRRLLEAGRTNLRAGQHYRPQRYPNRITLFRSTEVRPDEEGEAKFKIYDDPALGWSEFSSEPVEIHHIPGSHFTLLTEPHVEVLAARLKGCLERSVESALTARSS